jgi:hypothetical protein
MFYQRSYTLLKNYNHIQIFQHIENECHAAVNPLFSVVQERISSNEVIKR